MVNSLSQEQLAKFPQYVQEWTQRGLTTQQKSLAETVADWTEFQKMVLQKEPAPIVLLNSPLQCWLAVTMFSQGQQVRQQVGQQVWQQVEQQVEQQVRQQVESFVWPYFDCQFWASWFSFYEFIFNELKIANPCPAAYELFKRCSSYGMVFPLDNVCIVCQPPTVLKVIPRGLHCEDGPAVSYSGDNEIYALNGVVVPKELVMTPSESLSLDFFKGESNADVKAEFVRKYGVERMLDLGKIVDSFENYDYLEHEWWHRSKYELHNMGVLFGIEYQPYLKMQNMTTGIWHVEAVSPACRTLKDAIKERFGGRDMKIVAIA